MKDNLIPTHLKLTERDLVVLAFITQWIKKYQKPMPIPTIHKIIKERTIFRSGTELKDSLVRLEGNGHIIVDDLHIIFPIKGVDE